MLYVFLADGFEEIEALTPIDFLKRAGKTVFSVGVGSKTVKGNHNIKVVCDLTVDDIEFDEELEGIILPGGVPGTSNLEKNETVQKAIAYCNENGLLIGAICAAPSILGHLGLLEGKKATCYPGYESELNGYIPTEKRVVTHSNIITAKGAGVASEFAFEIITYFYGEEKNLQIKNSLQCQI